MEAFLRWGWPSLFWAASFFHDTEMVPDWQSETGIPGRNRSKPENRGEFKGVSYVGKCPNTLCSDYALLNGRSPGGVRDCVFIIRL